MVHFLIADIILFLLVVVPLILADRQCTSWVNRMSDRLWPFERPRRFARRSWAARSFILKTPVEEVQRRVDLLTEMEWSSARTEQETSRKDAGFDITALGPMLGSRKVSTGIEIEWLDPHTAEMRVRQYADWPRNSESDVRLPLKQRQRMAEHILLYVEPTSPEETRVSYEMETPTWLYVLVAAAGVFTAWLSLQMWGYQIRRDPSIPVVVLSIALLWVISGWASRLVVRILRHESVSLLDNVIATFGQLRSGKGSGIR